MTDRYEHRIVAYIDILAFSEKIKATENENDTALAGEVLLALTKALKFFQERINQSIENLDFPEGTRVSMFSDTLVISIPKAESKGALHLFELLKELQIQLIEKNILLRGAIVHGSLIHEDQLIIGPALINAYNVESKSAVYPRIVIDPRVLALYIREDGVSNHSLRLRDYDYYLTFKEDFDGTYYIDYFNSVDEYAPLKDAVTYFKLLSEMVSNGVKNQKDTGIRMKYMWMREKIKQANYPEEIKQPVKGKKYY